MRVSFGDCAWRLGLKLRVPEPQALNLRHESCALMRKMRSRKLCRGGHGPWGQSNIVALTIGIGFGGYIRLYL